VRRKWEPPAEGADGLLAPPPRESGSDSEDLEEDEDEEKEAVGSESESGSESGSESDGDDRGRSLGVVRALAWQGGGQGDRKSVV
jgi:hypothetical protein